MPRTRYSRRRLLILPTVVVIIGLVILTVKLLDPDVHLVLAYGTLLITSGISLTNLVLIWTTREPADVMFRDGYDLGYQAGLTVGQREGSRVVVPLRRVVGTGREAG
jgi:hypothetical protein